MEPLKKLQLNCKRRVYRMLLNGFTWTKINTVLRAHGQKQIVKVQHSAEGIRITYGYTQLQMRHQRNKKGVYEQVPTEPMPEVVKDNKN